MSRRPALMLVAWLLLPGLVVPVHGQQEEGGEAMASSDTAKSGSDGDAAEPPSITMVHFGPDSAGGSLAALHPEQALALGQGDMAFTGLLKRETTAERHGGLLIVAPSGQSPDQGIAGAVRSQLPDAGWMTLAIAQPAEPVAGLPERVFEPGQASAEDAGKEAGGTDGDPPDGEGDGAAGANGDGDAGDEAAGAPDMTIQVAQGSTTAERGDDWRTRATGRLEAAMNALRDEGAGVTVLVGIGDGADLVVRYARANGATFPPDQFGMVWVDARLRPPFNDGLAAELGEGYRVPILDLYDRDLRPRRAEQRAAAARRGGFAAYTQSALPIPDGASAREQRRIPARIRGWLSDDLKPAGE